MVSHVVSEVTAITERPQIALVVVRRIVIQVGRCQHHFALRPLRGLAVPFLASARAGVVPMEPALAHALTTTSRSGADARDDGCPVLWVPFAVYLGYGHVSLPLQWQIGLIGASPRLGESL